MAILDGPGLFRNTIIPTIGGTGAVRRIPFTFTSTARLLRSGKLKALGNDFARLQAAQDRRNELASIELATRGINVADQLGLSSTVNSIQNALQLSVGLGMPIIEMAVNPHAIKWSQNKRITKRDTMNGSVFFHFTNDDDQNNDILSVSFTGRTGNINTQGSIIDAFSTGSSLKLRIWHELYNLTREPLLLSQKNAGQGLPRGLKNEFFITYRSVLIPVQITLIGHFSKVLEFTEVADDPYNREYNLTFTVINTSPRLDDLSALMNSALSITGQTESLISNITSLGIP
jgi:hypothetical protein